MLTHLTPPYIRPPFARYAHGVMVEAGTRLMFLSGQLGIGPDDEIPEGEEEQAALCFSNIDAVLREGGMSARNVVRFNAYVTDRAYLAGYMRARDAYIAGIDPPPASTLMVVSGFARPEFRVEVEAIAAG